MLIVPAIHVKHAPLLRRHLCVSRIGETVYVYWRVPMAVGRRVALARRTWLRYRAGTSSVPATEAAE